MPLATKASHSSTPLTNDPPIISMKRIIVDLDNTITSGTEGSYMDAIPNLALIEKLSQYQAQGFEIVIHTSRNVRTYSGNIGKINAFTLPIILEWLEKHRVPYDEIYVAKPWCGNEGFYIDDRAIRPSEFLSLSHEQISSLLKKEEGKE